MIIPIAILNGGFREYVLMVHLEILALPLSGIILSVCIFLVAYLFVPKIKGCVKRDYILFGVMWFVLTNLFDLSSYIKSGEGFAGLLQSYNILTGNTWILVVLSALISPIDLKVKEYMFTLMLADPSSPYSVMNDGYCGDGGIPGYIFGSLVPSETTKTRIPVVLAHETNHNVRFQYIKWSNEISLAEYMICEGLAENFAVKLYGEENLGPWVSKTDQEMLNEYIKPLIQDALEVQGFDNITSYMYGDEMAKLQNYIPVGMPYCAGYACGYYMVKYYLDKTGKDIVDATILPAEEILKEIDGFWSETTIIRKGNSYEDSK